MGPPMPGGPPMGPPICCIEDIPMGGPWPMDGPCPIKLGAFKGLGCPFATACAALDIDSCACSYSAPVHHGTCCSWPKRSRRQMTIKSEQRQGNTS